MPGDVSVVIDLAHNEAGLEALLEIMNGVRRPGARLLLGLGAVGDRTDELIEQLGEIGARDSDVVAIGAQGAATCAAAPSRSSTRCSAPAPRGSASTDVDVVPHRGGVPGGARRRRPQPGDVVGLMCHAERAGGLRLDRRARRHAGRHADAGREGAGGAPAVQQL